MEAQRRFSPDRSDAGGSPSAPSQPTWEITPFDDIEGRDGSLCLLPDSLPPTECAAGQYCVLPEPPPQDRLGDDRWEITPFDDVEMAKGTCCLLPEPLPEVEGGAVSPSDGSEISRPKCVKGSYCLLPTPMPPEMVYGRYCLLPTPTPHEMAKGQYCLLPEPSVEASVRDPRPAPSTDIVMREGSYCLLPDSVPEARAATAAGRATSLSDVQMGVPRMCLLPDLPGPEDGLPVLETTATC